MHTLRLLGIYLLTDWLAGCQTERQKQTYKHWDGHTDRQPAYQTGRQTTPKWLRAAPPPGPITDSRPLAAERSIRRRRLAGLVRRGRNWVTILEIRRRAGGLGPPAPLAASPSAPRFLPWSRILVFCPPICLCVCLWGWIYACSLNECTYVRFCIYLCIYVCMYICMDIGIAAYKKV